MQTENSSKNKPKKKTKTKILKILSAVIIVLLLLTFFLMPALVSSDRGRRLILARINDSVDGKTEIAGLSMSWWKGLNIRDLKFKDSVGQTKINVKHISTKPHYASLLAGAISFGKTVVDEPSIEIQLKDYTSSRPTGEKGSARKSSAPIAFPVKKIDFVVNNGNLKVTDAHAESVELSRINSSVNLRPPGSKTSFALNMAVVDKGKESKIAAVGQIKPDRRAGWSLKGADGNLTVEIDDLELESLSSIFALAGIEIEAKGRVSANIETEVKDGRIEKSEGNINAENLDITGPALKGDRLKTGVLGINVKLQRKKDMINIDKFDLVADWAKAEIHGVVPTSFESLSDIVSPGSKYEVKANFDCDIAAIASQMPATLGITEAGQITAGTLTGSLETFTEDGERKIAGSANLVGLEGVVDGKSITFSQPLTTEIQITSDKTGIKYDKLRLTSSFAEVDCSGTGQLLKCIANVDLEKLKPFAVMLASLPKETELAGTAESTFFVSSKKDIWNIKTDATKIDNLKFSSPGKKPFEQSIVQIIFDTDIDTKNKDINVKKFELISPQIKIKGNINQKTNGPTTNLQGRADCEYDWQTVSGFASAFLPEGMELTGQRTDSFSFSSRYPADKPDQLIANLSTKGKFGFDKAEFMGLNFGPTEIAPGFQNGLLTIPLFSSTVNDGQLSFAAQADFKEKPTLLRMPKAIEIAKDIQINDQTGKKLLMYVNPIFANAVNISGTANFHCQTLAIPLAGGDKNNTEIAGTLSLSNVRLQASDLLGQILSVINENPGGQKITVHPTEFVLKNGLLRYDNMQIDVGDNPINFKGVIGLDKSLDMEVTLPYTFEGKTVRIGDEHAERMTLSLRGSVDDPQLDLGKLLERQIKKRLEQEIQKGLEGFFK